MGATIFVPPLVFYEGSTSSLAWGVSLSCLLLISVAVFSSGRIYQLRHQGLLVVGPLTFITLHTVCVTTSLPVDFVRALASCAVLALMLVAGSALAGVVVRCSSDTLDRAMAVCLALMGLVAVFAALGLSVPSSANYDKPTFPFTEPSLFALSFAPLLMYASIVSRGRRRLLVLGLALGVALALQNLTLMVAWSLVAAVCLRRWALVGVVALIAGLGSQIDLSYYLARLDFSDGALNLSNLVYLQGWQIIGESWSKSSGWGVGFQQLGLNGSDTTASDLIYSLIGTFSNLTDGGFTLAKVVSEFGVFGLLIVAVFFRKAGQAWQALRRIAHGEANASRALVFAQSVVLCYCVELLVRGTGYFSGTAILLVSGLVILRGYRTSLASRAARPVPELLARS